MSIHQETFSTNSMIRYTHQLSGLEHQCEAFPEVIAPTASHIVDVPTPFTRAFETLQTYLVIRGMMSTTLRLIERYSLTNVISAIAHSHLALYRQGPTDLDLERLSAMDGIAQRHLSICENLKVVEGEQSRGEKTLSKKSAQDRNFLRA